MKPIRHSNLEEMTTEQLHNKRSDIISCAKTANSKESKEGYNRQLEVLDSILRQRLQLTLQFERKPSDDEQEE